MLVTKNQYILLAHMLQFSAKTTNVRNFTLQNIKKKLMVRLSDSMVIVHYPFFLFVPFSAL